MEAPSVFILSSPAGEAVAQTLGKLLTQNGLPRIELGCVDRPSGSDGLADTPRRMSTRHDFGIRVVMPADLGPPRKADIHNGLAYDLGVMSGALGIGRGVVLLVDVDGVEPNLGSGFAGLVVDHVTVDTSAELNAQLGAYARLLAGRVRDLDTTAGLMMLPSTGLSIGYFKNFVAPVLETLRSRRAVLMPLSGDGAGEARRLDLASSRLVICLPDSAENVTPGAWAALARQLQLRQAQLGPDGDDGTTRRFGVWADQSGVLYDAPTTLATATEVVRRMVTDGVEEDRVRARRRAVHNFERTLRLLMREAEYAWINGRLEIATWSDLERRAGAG